MEELKFYTNKYYRNDLNDKLKSEYVTALKDPKFKALTNKFKLTDEDGMKYTSKLEMVVSNLKNCERCKGLVECKNEVNGCVYYPTKVENGLDFNYVTCKYKNKEILNNKLNKSKFFGLSEDIKNANMSLIDDVDFKKRSKVIKCLKDFYDNYPNEKKGLYLHGSFGSGKTFLIACLLNELAKKDFKTILLYYPEMLSRLKASFDGETESYKDMLDEIKTSDILLIDDIGAETVTTWSRDEVLGTILQYRMENNLSTFITSNLNIEELETHLSIVKNNMDKVKARRIIERIKQLTTDMEMISVNRRN
ncbi:MAG: primosomal protein DnaI [Bacilli bacterium]|nr:primosomal protein DnaI [Bacilli bacterium]